MFKKKGLILSMAVMLGAAALTTGCGSRQQEITGTSGDGTSSVLSAETEIQTVIPSTMLFTSRWYGEDMEGLSGYTIEIYNGDTLLTSGATDETFTLSYRTIPTNTALTFVVKDANGNTLATSEITYTITDDITDFQIIPYEEDETAQTIEVPADRTNVIAVLYIDSSGRVAHASITQNRSEDAVNAENAQEEIESDEESTDSDESTDTDTTEESTASEESSAASE